MEQAVAYALAHNPTLLAAQQNLLSIKGQEVEAGLRQNPDFGFTGSDITLPADNPGNPYSYSLQLSRLFERGQKRRWRLDSARATTAQTRRRSTIRNARRLSPSGKPLPTCCWPRRPCSWHRTI